MTELSTRYMELTNARPDRRWSDATLTAKIAEFEAEARRAAVAKAQREADAAVAEAQRNERIAQRGDFETFAARTRRSDSESDYRLARAIGWAANVISLHEETAAKFAKDFASNPAHAMAWAEGAFTHAANYTVATQVKGMFEGGATLEGMLQCAMREVMHKAKYPARSTSPCSNLVEQETLRAWTNVAGKLDGSEF